ncbi:putrescine transport system substrate-binding protein [Pseudomonas sp. JAI115]|uniref:extracellular solute-binding protein n=1 Tax=Pseudomonas sp. JAI115 TaxID=2723061 RepID=UPI00161CE293|nr:extracellular solute-binding protein [Pseudomonas sp. JAI115]MBB6153719.1 putrescine transport system substrate-binding protein [Pseudomonas sp. JAI115]
MKNAQWFHLVTALVLGAGACASVLANGDRVRLFNWSELISPDTPTDFKKETGITVVNGSFDTADVMLSTIMAGRSGYDVVVATSNVLPTLIQAGALQELDRSKLSNWKHLDPEVLQLLEANDPHNRYAIPYLLGTTGIGYDVDKVRSALGDNAPVDSWAIVFKEENISKLKQCGVAMLDAPSEMVSIALHYLGLPHNSTNADDYQKAQELLLKIRPYIRYFNSGKLPQELANGDVCLIVSWAGDANVAMDASASAKNGRRIAYSIPKEGALVWSENLVLLKDAPHPEQGVALLNYLMRPEVIAKVGAHTGYATGNKDAEIPLTKNVIENPGLKPSHEVMKTLFPLESLPSSMERIRTRIWTKVKTG